MSSFTKPCNVLSMFLNFEPWKPYVLISFVLIKKKRVVVFKNFAKFTAKACVGVTFNKFDLLSKVSF